MSKELKKSIYNKLRLIIDERIETIREAIASAKESRDQDSKSSVGDKYETGRAIMQAEIKNQEDQLDKAVKLKKELSQINIDKTYGKVEFGSLVITDHGAYFIAIGLGAVEIKEQSYYSISLASPIGKSLYGRKAGQEVQFQNKKIRIISIF